MEQAAIIASTGQIKTMADGTLRITIEVPPTHAKIAFELFGFPGTAVAVARITQQAATKEAQKQTMDSAYGQAYSSLYKAGFMYSKALHRIIFDEEELASIQGADPREISEKVRNRLHEIFGVESLTQVPPQTFYDELAGHSFPLMYPKEFLEYVKESE